ncbi:MAG: VWA domain-containing protein [Cytophagales bacterium]|nr:VWA domain-containing protein [Cytophagales bacterium]
MKFSHELSNTHFILIGLFVFFYALYFLRTARAAKEIRSSFYNIAYKFVLRSVYFSLFIICTLEPYLPNQNGKQEIQTVSKDVYIALDLSLSMNANDVSPSRLQRIKFELKKISKRLAGNRMGLIIFSSSAYVQCPLTYDLNAFQLFVDSSDPSILSHSGTDIARPLKLGLSKLKKDTDTKSHAKAIVLISDGEDFGEEMYDIAEDIQSEGIKVFTLGIGTTQGSAIPTKHGKKRDKRGQIVTTSLDRTSLKKLAKITNGRYFEISNRKNDSQRLTNAIEQLKGTSRESIKVSTPKNVVYHYFLYIALGLLIIDLIFAIKVLKI